MATCASQFGVDSTVIAACTNACTVLLVPFGFKADALKAGAEMGDQVLNIVRIQA